MAEYCHSSCSKCPPFARIRCAKTSCHSSLLYYQLVWLMPCRKHAENAASVHNTYLDKNHKIDCYLQRIFNRNQKSKQQVSKWAKCIKIGCMFKNHCMLHFCLHFLPTQTAKFWQVVRQHTNDMMGSITGMWILLEIYFSFQQWKMFENPLRIDKVLPWCAKLNGANAVSFVVENVDNLWQVK